MNLEMQTVERELRDELSSEYLDESVSYQIYDDKKIMFPLCKTFLKNLEMQN